MAHEKRKSPFDEKLTLAEVRARVGEIKPVRKIEGQGGGGVRPGAGSKSGALKRKR